MAHTPTHTPIVDLSDFSKKKKFNCDVREEAKRVEGFLDSPVLRQLSLLIGQFGTSCMHLDCR